MSIIPVPIDRFLALVEINRKLRDGGFTPLTSSLANDYPEWLIGMNEGVDKPDNPLPLATADCMLRTGGFIPIPRAELNAAPADAEDQAMKALLQRALKALN
jgi:hypothetical protein